MYSYLTLLPSQSELEQDSQLAVVVRKVIALNK